VSDTYNPVCCHSEQAHPYKQEEASRGDLPQVGGRPDAAETSEQVMDQVRQQRLPDHRQQYGHHDSP
jgi:hypothetical protein